MYAHQGAAQLQSPPVTWTCTVAGCGLGYASASHACATTSTHSARQRPRWTKETFPPRGKRCTSAGSALLICHCSHCSSGISMTSAALPPWLLSAMMPTCAPTRGFQTAALPGLSATCVLASICRGRLPCSDAAAVAMNSAVARNTAQRSMANTMRASAAAVSHLPVRGSRGIHGVRGTWANAPRNACKAVDGHLRSALRNLSEMTSQTTTARLLAVAESAAACICCSSRSSCAWAQAKLHNAILLADITLHCHHPSHGPPCPPPPPPPSLSRESHDTPRDPLVSEHRRSAADTGVNW